MRLIVGSGCRAPGHQHLLTAAPGETLFGQDAKLPAESVGMLGRIGPVTSTSATADVDAAVYRSDRIPESETGGSR